VVTPLLLDVPLPELPLELFAPDPLPELPPLDVVPLEPPEEVPPSSPPLEPPEDVPPSSPPLKPAGVWDVPQPATAASQAAAPAHPTPARRRIEGSQTTAFAFILTPAPTLALCLHLFVGTADWDRSSRGSDGAVVSRVKKRIPRESWKRGNLQGSHDRDEFH
jgi:hypothetical protein